MTIRDYDFAKNNMQKAKGILEGVPDKTATHYVWDTDTYFSEEFHTYFDHSLKDWETSDLHCVSDLEANYQIVLDLSELKQAIADFELVEFFAGSLEGAKQLIEFAKGCSILQMRDRAIKTQELEESIKRIEGALS